MLETEARPVVLQGNDHEFERSTSYFVQYLIVDHVPRTKRPSIRHSRHQRWYDHQRGVFRDYYENSIDYPVKYNIPSRRIVDHSSSIRSIQILI